jgi:DNA-binding transcriptional regulator YhcF (GntR family)
MTTKMGVRDVVRNFSELEKYDYVEIEDKKTKEPKGMFISAKLAKELKDIIEQKAKEQKEEKLNKLMQFVGAFNGEFKDLTSQEIKALKREKYYNE